MATRSRRPAAAPQPAAETPMQEAPPAVEPAAAAAPAPEAAPAAEPAAKPASRRAKATKAASAVKPAPKKAASAAKQPKTDKAPKTPDARPKTAKAAPAAGKPAKETRDKPAKLKVVRDSFTIPKAEYAVLQALKERAIQSGHAVKKSELLRAGLQVLAALPDAGFLSAVKAVEPLKTGRPAKD